MALLRNASLALALCWAMPFVCATGEEAKPKDDSVKSAFASTIAQIEVPSRNQAVPVTWKFTNLWGFPMVVERFEESCGCLSGQKSAESVAPGESGTIRATFTPGTLRGVQRKSLHVRFVGHDKPVELVAETTIPASVQLSSQQLDWIPADKSEMKTVDVTSGTGVNFTITGILGAHESQFTIDQKTITPGRHYQLAITPANPATTESVNAAIQIRTDSPDPRDQVLVLLLRQAPREPKHP